MTPLDFPCTHCNVAAGEPCRGKPDGFHHPTRRALRMQHKVAQRKPRAKRVLGVTEVGGKRGSATIRRPIPRLHFNRAMEKVIAQLELDIAQGVTS
jgi:hypothetical protein